MYEVSPDAVLVSYRHDSCYDELKKMDELLRLFSIARRLKDHFRTRSFTPSKMLGAARIKFFCVIVLELFSVKDNKKHVPHS